MTSKNKSQRGICKLTLEEGKFVKSHIIPQAFTKPSIKGSPLIQYGNNDSRPKKRWSSWYDPSLVIEKGEKILTKYDTWAITELRRHKLVWSGWGANTNLGDLHKEIPVIGRSGIRQVEGIDTKKLRLFFLSLLWRAAATNLPEFSEISLPTEDLEKLRLMLITENYEPLSFYPMSLTQLSTIGLIHNQTPFPDKMNIPSIMGSKARILSTYRFYFDGLISHIHINNNDNTATPLSPLIVGANEKIVLSTQSYEHSFQRENVIHTTIRFLPNIT